MGSATPERRTPRRMLSILATLGLMAGVFTITAASASASACLATDGVASSSNLQTIVDGALTGDTITVKGICTGNFSFPGGGTAASLTLWGKGQPKATLDGNHSGSVVSISTSITVTLKNVLVTNGNTAFSGGGISNSGTVNLSGNTQVNGNTANFDGGGILNDGDVNVSGTAQVNGNTAGSAGSGYLGGGIYNIGTVILSANAQVNGNTAGSFSLGGGIYNIGTVKLKGKAQVNGNTAVRGGGIANNNGKVTAARTWTGTVSGNSLDNCDPDNLVPGCV